MKVLSLWQPWASLVAFGRKRIETRSWSTSYRGPLMIHAAKRPPVSGECPGSVIVDGVGDLMYLLPDGGWTEEDQVAAGLEPDGDVLGIPLPLGAVVATCELVSVAPIGGPRSFSTGLFEGMPAPTAGIDVLVRHPPLGGALGGESLILDRWNGPTVDVSDQLPFGDFGEGRYGWLLEEICAVWPPVPRRGHQGLRDA